MTAVSLGDRLRSAARGFHRGQSDLSFLVLPQSAPGCSSAPGRSGNLTPQNGVSVAPYVQESHRHQNGGDEDPGRISDPGRGDILRG